MTNELLLKNNKTGDDVLSRVKTSEVQGDLQLPANYSPENVMKSAMLQLQELKGSKKDGRKPALEFTTLTSIVNALVNVIVQGLNSAKNQGYFIMYGDKVQSQRSYHKTMAITRRVIGAKEINAEVILEGGKTRYRAENGKIVKLEHIQLFGNGNTQDIIGTCATIIFKDESRNYIEIMTFEEIEETQKQSQIAHNGVFKEDGTHRRFPQEMAKKTVINRAYKEILNSTDNASLLSNQIKESEQCQRKEVLDTEVEENANQGQLDFEPPVSEEARYTELENEKPIDVSDSEEIREPTTKKESEEESF